MEITLAILAGAAVGIWIACMVIANRLYEIKQEIEKWRSR